MLVLRALGTTSIQPLCGRLSQKRLFELNAKRTTQHPPKALMKFLDGYLTFLHGDQHVLPQKEARYVGLSILNPQNKSIVIKNPT